MATYIDIDAPIDVAVYQRNRRITVTLRQILESNDAKWTAADVRENKRGKWMYDDDMNTGIYAICSCCKESIYQAFEFYYCPNCGADMREESE